MKIIVEPSRWFVCSRLWFRNRNETPLKLSKAWERWITFWWVAVSLFLSRRMRKVNFIFTWIVWGYLWKLIKTISTRFFLTIAEAVVMRRVHTSKNFLYEVTKVQPLTATTNNLSRGPATTNNLSRGGPCKIFYGCKIFLL